MNLLSKWCLVASFYLRSQLHALFLYKKNAEAPKFFFGTPTFIIEPLFKHIKEGTLDFYDIEQIMWKSSMYIFQRFLKKILVGIDKYLMASRDLARYELKERTPRTIETLVGPLEINRRYYWDKKENRWVYLLDEKLKLEKYKALSPGLLKLAVTCN